MWKLSVVSIWKAFYHYIRINILMISSRIFSWYCSILWYEKNATVTCCKTILVVLTYPLCAWFCFGAQLLIIKVLYICAGGSNHVVGHCWKIKYHCASIMSDYDFDWWFINVSAIYNVWLNEEHTFSQRKLQATFFG